MDNASTMNGSCFHFFESKSDGLKCKECGYLLPLVSSWPVPQTTPTNEIVNWHGSDPGWSGSGKYVRKTDIQD